ncbi:MAG: aminomethyltransferase beta-barrel domain-containing protein, partial [Actinomycetes bacterium]
GKKLGEHKGAYTYTIGQRKGLGLTVPAAGGVPRYVLKVEPITNTVVVGTHEALAVEKIIGGTPNWCGPAPEALASSPLNGLVQVRAHGAPLPCTYYRSITEGIEILIADLVEPLFGLAPGQAMVIYDGDRVVGSATITETK